MAAQAASVKLTDGRLPRAPRSRISPLQIRTPSAAHESQQDESGLAFAVDHRRIVRRRCLPAAGLLWIREDLDCLGDVLPQFGRVSAIM
jgi:hypothetical protein